MLKIISAGVMIGGGGFYAVDWNGSNGGAGFVLSGDEGYG